MKLRATAVSLLAATMLFATPAVISGAAAQTPAPAQVNSRILPIAAGALVGAAAGFFLLPWIIPATAVAATAGASTTASPTFGLIGAGIGSFIGFETAR
jgi:hypothetical protein